MESIFSIPFKLIIMYFSDSRYFFRSSKKIETVSFFNDEKFMQHCQEKDGWQEIVAYMNEPYERLKLALQIELDEKVQKPKTRKDEYIEEKEKIIGKEIIDIEVYNKGLKAIKNKFLLFYKKHYPGFYINFIPAILIWD